MASNQAPETNQSSSDEKVYCKNDKMYVHEEDQPAFFRIDTTSTPLAASALVEANLVKNYQEHQLCVLTPLST